MSKNSQSIVKAFIQLLERKVRVKELCKKFVKIFKEKY